MIRAVSVAKMTVGPSSPTTLAPTVNKPTPITVPVVIVIASRRPRQRLSSGEGAVSCISVPSFLGLDCFFILCVHDETGASIDLLMV